MATDGRNRPVEQPAVRTTIVGGRPPGPGKGVGEVPRGIEVLVKKASVDPDFRRLLLEKRAEAAKEIELKLDPAEVAMLTSVPAAQLDAIIGRTTVDPMSRAAFFGKAAAVMLAALSAGSGCDESERPPAPKGILADRPKVEEPVKPPARPATPVPAAKPGTSAPAAKPPSQPEQPIMPVAGAVPTPIPREPGAQGPEQKPGIGHMVTKGMRPDKP
jgi:hypothetical protein